MAQPPKSKIYTRGGDKGETSLIFGSRVSKDHPRVMAYGSVDELNTAIGAAVSFIRERKLVKQLQSIQNELFNIGAELSSPKKLKKSGKNEYYQLQNEKIDELEKIIDFYDSKLPALKNFILPGGSKAASLVHSARTSTRRAERFLVTLSKKESINPNVIAYINRLSDLLFVLARYLNKKARVKELPWKKD